MIHRQDERLYLRWRKALTKPQIGTDIIYVRE